MIAETAHITNLKSRMAASANSLLITVSCILLSSNTAHGLNNSDGQLASTITKTNEQVYTPQTLLHADEMLLQREESSFIYCTLGIYLENLKLGCDSETFIRLQRDIRDIDKPAEAKMSAIIVSSIAVGCKETAVYLHQLLRDAHENMPMCNLTHINGPTEKDLNRCDFKTLKHIESLIEPNKQLKLVYQITAPPLLYTLGCPRLANYTMTKLYEHFKTKLNGSAEFKQLKHNATYRKNDIMNYMYKHKTDMYNAWKIHNLAEEPEETENNIVKRACPNVSVITNKIIHVHKRNIEEGILEYFTVHLKCSIVMPLGTLLQPISKLGCLQFCLDEDSCQSAGYTNDNSAECHLNTEVADDVGPSFFTCGDNESTRWDYFEKKKPISYFQISSKLTGEILQATSGSSVALRHYNGNDNQFWFWKGDLIVSKEHPDRVLTASLLGRVFLSSPVGSKQQKWNFEEESLISQYDNRRMSVRYPLYGVTVSQYTSSNYQKWSLSFERVYFIITNRLSGKVLDVSLLQKSTPGHVHMWSYHGRDNQLWFWDDDCIRSKQFPSKVLDLHMRDYSRDKWGKVYLHQFHGGDNQRWEMDGNIIISKYKRLRLDVKQSDMTDGALVGGYTHTGNPSQWWTVGTFRTFFFILNKDSGKVINATPDNKIIQWHYHNGKRQLWFWDGEALRNKEHTDKVLDVSTDAFGKNRGQNLILNSFQDKPSQSWSYRENYLICGNFNLSIVVRDGSLTDGAYIAAQNDKTQKWSLNPEHDFFIITSRQDASVLTAGDKNKKSTYMISVQPYSGADEQQWYWDDDTIRSKAFPERVIDIHRLDYIKDLWGKVYLHPYHGGKNQRWTIREDQFISHYKDLRLDRKKGRLAGAATNTGKLNQMWSFNSKNKIYFVIQGKAADKVLDVSHNLDIIIWNYHGGDNQLWFWDKDSLRSKEYPDKVLDLHISNFRKDGWGKVYLLTYHGGNNQKWKIDGDNIISNFDSLYLDVKEESTNNGASVGGYPSTGNANQQWIITTPNHMKTSCIDETEKKIYDVVQWIPILSTAWELYSSIGYGAAGCNSVAEERAVSMAIGITMDVATVATGGAAAGVMTVAKTGLKVGIKFGLKHGMKAAVKITQQSIKQMFKKAVTNIAESGIKRSLINGVKRAGKLVLRETILDPALFYKNIGKLTKSILSHPLKTLKQTWKAAKQTWKAASRKIDDLKKLKNKIKYSKKTHIDYFNGENMYNVRCKRGGGISCLSQKSTKGYSERQERLYHQLFDDNAVANNVETCAERFMAQNAKSIDKLPTAIKDKLAQLSSKTDIAELIAVHEYTKYSGGINPITQNILEGTPLQHTRHPFESNVKELLSRDVDAIFNHAILVQDYLKKNPLKQPILVYRFEEEFMAKYYEDNGVYITKKFISTLEENVRFSDHGIDLVKNHPIELSIYLEKSGTNIADISNYPSQREWLIPIGTKFKVRKVIDDDGIIKVTLREIVEK